MAKFNSKSSKFFLNDSGDVERELTSYITTIDGLPGEVEMQDSTTLADSGRKHEQGLENSRITLELIWDDTATSGPDVVLSGLRSDNTENTFKYGPKGDTAGFPRYTGSFKLADYRITSRLGELVRATATLLVQGTVTKDAF